MTSKLMMFIAVLIVFITGCKESNSNRNKVNQANQVSEVDQVKQVDQVTRVLHVPEEFETIQSALDAAKSGDKVLIAGRSFAENIEFRNGVSVVGDPEKTVISGSMRFDGLFERVLISGLRMENINTFCYISESSVDFDYCTFSTGGIEIIANSNVTIHNCTFDGDDSSNNIAIDMVSSRVVIERSIFTNWEVALRAPKTFSTDSSGEFRDCIFYNNFQSISGFEGAWSGDINIQNPLYTNRSFKEYYLDDNSPAIYSNKQFAGAWKPAIFNARPFVHVDSLYLIASPGWINALEFIISANGKSGSFITFSSLSIRVNANKAVSFPVRWALIDVSGRATLKEFYRPILDIPDGESFEINVEPIIINVGEVKAYRLYVDLREFNNPSYTFEVVLENMIWTDENGLVNDSGANMGLPASSGVFIDP